MSVPSGKTWINRAVFLRVGAGIALVSGALCATLGTKPVALPYLFTEAPRYDPTAWLDGRDRFPAGATLNLVAGETRRALVGEFYASADATVSDDGRQVLFSAKPAAGDRWQIWEVALNGGAPKRIAREDADCIRPLYLPGHQIVYTRVERDGSAIIVGGKAVTFAPGRYLTDQVLQDGRILFEASREHAREIYTVYPDGTGVEALRCDHGPDRGEARQLASGDYVFRAGKRLARFTSAEAAQSYVLQPDGEAIGPVAEAGPGVWLLSMRTGTAFGLYRWNAADRRTTPLEAGTSAVDPVVVAPRTPPREFPSALVPTRTAGNLLCLNARMSRTPIDGPAVKAVRVYSEGGLLGETAVEADGSFYVQVPADRPIRIETVDAAGRTVQAERGWFWMRPSEQRICVGCHTGPERAPENKVPEVLLRTIVPVKMLEVHP